MPRLSYVEQVDQDRDTRHKYDEIKDALEPEQVEKIDKLREEAQTRPYNGYGHDLVAAIARGWRRKAAEAIREAMRCGAKASSYGNDSDYKPRFLFSMTLYVLIEEAARKGATVEEIRRTMQDHLDSSDDLRIEKIVERANR